MLDIDRLRAAMQNAGRRVTFVHYVENNLENDGWRSLSVHFQELTGNQVYEVNFTGADLDGPSFEANVTALERHGKDYTEEQLHVILNELGFFPAEPVDAVPTPDAVAPGEAAEIDVVLPEKPKRRTRRRAST